MTKNNAKIGLFLRTNLKINNFAFCVFPNNTAVSGLEA